MMLITQTNGTVILEEKPIRTFYECIKNYIHLMAVYRGNDGKEHKLEQSRWSVTPEGENAEKTAQLICDNMNRKLQDKSE